MKGSKIKIIAYNKTKQAKGITNCQNSTQKQQEKNKYINISHRKHFQNKIPRIKTGQKGASHKEQN